jgi:hypothetical protein
MGVLAQALEIIFEVKRKEKKVMKKIVRIKISFLTYKTFFFPSLDLSYFQTS